MDSGELAEWIAFRARIMGARRRSSASARWAGVGWVTRTRLPLSFSVIVLTFLFWDLDHDKPTTSGRVWQWPLPAALFAVPGKLRRSHKIARAGAHALRRAWRCGIMMDLI